MGDTRRRPTNRMTKTKLSNPLMVAFVFVIVIYNLFLIDWPFRAEEYGLFHCSSLLDWLMPSISRLFAAPWFIETI